MSCNPKELKELRRFPIPEAVLEGGRERLRIVMAELPFVPGARRHFGIFIWKPAMTLALIGVLVFSSGGAVMASIGAVPGERLYSVKLAVEGVRERLAVSPARKFTLQAVHASRRLEETEKLIVNEDLAVEMRDERIQAVLHEYEDHLFKMNALAVRLSVDPPKPKASARAIAAAERMFDRHAELVASATVTEPVVTAAVLAPIDMALELQNEVLESMFQESEKRDDRRDGDDENEDDRSHGKLEDRHRERTKKMKERLQLLRFELDLQAPLENPLKI
ncbi:MAG: DUF5667 domain-containing protein [Patescibacteria group bacterium]|nr:MAG: DUF5667 domain-containing protein [Patescibacteria group bacterium]